LKKRIDTPNSIGCIRIPNLIISSKTIAIYSFLGGHGTPPRKEERKKDRKKQGEKKAMSQGVS